MPIGNRTSAIETKKVDWHNRALWSTRQKRDKAVHDVPEWEELRALASQIKEHTLSKLHDYLIEFEENASQNGATVHWARNAKEHNDIVVRILKETGSSKVVKSKSMLTEECGLNAHLENLDIEVVDTDLGERIIQLNEEPPSHIIAPAIHLKKEEISDIFHARMQTETGNCDPQYLTEAARQDLRKRFLGADVAITGVNFAVAETGSVVVVTNEGNADMGVHAARVQIHCMGIEKIIPKFIHLGVFTRLLARSATGQPLSIYTSHHHSPRKSGQMHIILVDNGRTKALGRDKFSNSLKCIRCGACLNTCPVFRRTGGHSYGATVPGPIGSILNPGMDPDKYRELPFASSLCGSCSDVCPVKIDIHEQLYAWRQIVNQTRRSFVQKWLIAMTVSTLSSKRKFEKRSKMMRRFMQWMPIFLLKNPLNTWSKGRELPVPPEESFREWYGRAKN